MKGGVYRMLTLFPYNKSICVRQYGVHALQFLVIDYGGKSIEE